MRRAACLAFVRLASRPRWFAASTACHGSTNRNCFALVLSCDVCVEVWEHSRRRSSTFSPDPTRGSAPTSIVTVSHELFFLCAPSSVTVLPPPASLELRHETLMILPTPHHHLPAFQRLDNATPAPTSTSTIVRTISGSTTTSYYPDGPTPYYEPGSFHRKVRPSASSVSRCPRG